MKIIIVCYPTFGGSGVLATELGHKLAENGHEIHFIAYENQFDLTLMTIKFFFIKLMFLSIPCLIFNLMNLPYLVN